MQKENTSSASDKNNSVSGVNDRKKRIKRMKTAIIITVVALILLPTTCCILLGIRVYRLQQQVDELSGLHSKYGLSYDEHKDTNYAYAAVKDLEEADTSDALTNIVNVQDTSEEMPKEAEQESTQADAANNGNEQSEELLTDPKDTTTQIDSKNVDTVEKKNVSSNKEGKYAGKKVYLTFDDGPSSYTDDILDILSEYKVKATFFVIGKKDDWSKQMYQRIIEEGHTLGMHSYSHQYSKIYNSVEDFDKDFTKLWKLLYDTIGYKPSIFRFPGGSDNVVNKNSRNDIIRYLRKVDIVYYDWNVVNGDATGVEYTKQQLINNVLDGVEYKENCIVLMHDSQTKKTTVDSLPGLLESFLSEGAQLLPLSKDVTPIQMIKDDTVQ